MFNNSKMLNTKFVFLGTRGNTIYECSDRQKALRKDQKTYRKAIAQFNGFMDELEGINAFLVSTFSNKTSEGSTEETKLHDWQQRIINLYIQLIVDAASYKDKIDELQEIIDALQSIIDNFCENGPSVSARISYYKTQITKLIAEIQKSCDQLDLDFIYQPINHGSAKVHTIYSQLYDIVMKEYGKQKDSDSSNDYVDGERHNETDANPTKNQSVADEIANALMNENVNPSDTILSISNFANGKDFKFETKTESGKSVDFVKDGVIDDQDIAELKKQKARKDKLSDDEKAKYDINDDQDLNDQDIEAARGLIYKHTDDPENTPMAKLQEVKEPDPYNGYDYVEINGLKWATKNVGATSETDPGLYFRWGETRGYSAENVDQFALENYELSYDGKMSKYNNDDHLTILSFEDDAARANMGGEWRMPTKEDLESLISTSYIRSTSNGIEISNTADSPKVILPYGGLIKTDSLHEPNNIMVIMSSELDSSNIDCSWGITGSKTNASEPCTLTKNSYRIDGANVRGVIG